MARPAPGADRSVAVLELLADHPDERFTLSEVARRCGLNKATAHALLSALTAHGILLRHPDEKRYSLGPRLVAIGDAAERGYTAVDFAPSVLRRLAADTGLPATAIRLEDDVITVIARSGAGPDVEPMPNLPHIPPLGALFMAWTDEPSIEAWLARSPASEVVGRVLEALPAIRDHGFAATLASDEWNRLMAAMKDGLAHDRMRAMLADLGRRGALAAEVDERRSYRVAAVSAPVFRGDGRVELAVSTSAPASRPGGLDLPGDELLALGARVVAAAQELTLAVHGHRPPGPAFGPG